MNTIVPFLDSLALIQGLVLGLIIIVMGRNKVPALFFGLFVITYALELGDSIMGDFGYLNESNLRLQFLPLNFYFLNVALLYLYLETIVGRYSLKKHVWWLLPGILEFSIFTTVAIFFNHIPKDVLDQISDWHQSSAIVFYLLVSIYIMYRAIRYQKIIDETHTGARNANLKWIIGIGLYFILYSSYFLLADPSSDSMAYVIVSAINVVFIYIIGLLGLKQNYVEIGYEEEVLSDKKVDIVDVTKTESSSVPHQDKNNVESLIQAQFEKIDEKVKTNQYYLDAELSLFKLSRAVKVQSRKLSGCISGATGLNFKKYINSLRIEHAQRLLLDEANDQYTMTSIAFDSGFQSKSTFYSAFNEVVGMTPTAFKEQS